MQPRWDEAKSQGTRDIVNGEALRSVQSNNGKTKALRVKASGSSFAACFSTRTHPHLSFLPRAGK